MRERKLIVSFAQGTLVRWPLKWIVIGFIYDLHADTKHYWKLTKHIFRYGHVNQADSYNGAHTVNEGMLNQMQIFAHHGNAEPCDSS